MGYFLLILGLKNKDLKPKVSGQNLFDSRCVYFSLFSKSVRM